MGGKDYPAILVTTGDTDDRVVPAHSFKYAAALQAAELGPKPSLIRIDTKAGHGAGKSVVKLIDEYDDSYAFAAYYAGLRSEEHTSELRSLMRISYAVFRSKKKIAAKTDKH